MASINAVYPNSGVIGNDNDAHPHADDVLGNRAAYGTAGTSRDLAAVAFVRDLIRGTFDAIVDASIQQMEAFADLVASVARSLDRFLEENVSDDDARAWLDRTLPDIDRAEEPTAALALDAARRNTGKDRQQLLATMVLMGVNRALICE